MKLHFNPGTLLNKTHCGSELALLSEDTHTAHTCSHTHIHARTYAGRHMHEPHTNVYLHICDSRTHTVSALCSLKVIKPNEALQGHAAFSVFFEMMRGFVPRPQWNKRVGQNLCRARAAGELTVLRQAGHLMQTAQSFFFISVMMTVQRSLD